MSADVADSADVIRPYPGVEVRIAPDLPPGVFMAGDRVFRLATMEEVTGVEAERIRRWLSREARP